MNIIKGLLYAGVADFGEASGNGCKLMLRSATVPFLMGNGCCVFTVNVKGVLRYTGILQTK